MVLSLKKTLACPLSFTVFKCSGGNCFKKKEEKIFPPLYPAQLGFTKRAARGPCSGVSPSFFAWPHHYNQLNLGDLQRLPESSLSSFPFVSRRGAAPWIAGAGMEGREPAPGRGSSRCGHEVRWLWFCCTFEPGIFLLNIPRDHRGGNTRQQESRLTVSGLLQG